LAGHSSGIPSSAISHTAFLTNALVSVAGGIVLGLAVDSFLGAVLAHWMQNAFAVGSLFVAAALLALGAVLACLLPARHAIAVPPAEALRYE
jgi:ABC-type antimicrobial peptide transport system permease subunit